MLGDSLAGGTAYLDLRRIEVSREIATIMSRSRNRVFLEADTLLMNLTTPLNANLEKKSKADHERDLLKVQSDAAKAAAKL